MKLIQPSNRGEWLQIRRGYISSTESAALFGQSPYNTAFEIGVMKQQADSLDTHELIGTERTRWGLRLQDAIAQGVADDYGVMVEPMGLTYAVDEEARMGSSFDYKIVAVPSAEAWLHNAQNSVLQDFFVRLGPGLLEVKNVDSLEFKRKWVDDEAPEHIEIQLQHQLEVLGLPWGAIAALVGGNTARVIVRERDRKVGAIIRRKTAEFWTNFDKGILPDPLMPDDAEVLIALYKYAEPNKVFDGQGDKALEDLIFTYTAAGDQIKTHKFVQEVAKAKILQHIGDAEKALANGATIHAAMRAPVRVEAYDKKGYRDFRIFAKKEAPCRK